MPKSEKKRRREADEEDGADGIDARLAAYGERFMQMFDPTEADRRRAAPADDPPATSSSDWDGSDGDDSDDISSEEDFGAADAAVERIFAGGAKAAAAAGSRLGKGPKVMAAAALPPPLPPDIAKMERKRFMSHKAGVVAGATPVAPPPPRGRAKAEDASAAGGLTKEEFEKLKREVHMYGASALDKKSKKAFEAAVLEELGAKKAKGPRMSAKIGLGMAKKQKKREAVAMEEAVAAGMVRVKGTGKKKRAEKRAGLDKGLMEDGGAFRGGVLKVARAGGKRGGGSGGRRGGGGPRR